MKEQIKKLRVKIDGLAQLTKKLKPQVKEELTFYINEEIGKNEILVKENSKEIDKAVDSLYLAKAWLGKILGELGENTPYKNDGNRKTVEDIEPTADKPDMMGVFENSVINGKRWDTKFHIEKVDWLREEIKETTEDLIKWYTHTQAPSREFSIARTNTYNYLCEARFWLGFELGRIKEQENE